MSFVLQVCTRAATAEPPAPLGCAKQGVKGKSPAFGDQAAAAPTLATEIEPLNAFVTVEMEARVRFLRRSKLLPKNRVYKLFHDRWERRMGVRYASKPHL